MNGIRIRPERRGGGVAGHQGSRLSGGRRGFTLVELLLVMAIVGILAAVGIPKLGAAARKGIAAAVVSDYNTIRHAANEYLADSNTWPGSGQWGAPPAWIVPHLPDGFPFEYEDGLVEYRWRGWTPSQPGRPQAGLQIRSDDPEIMAAIQNIYVGRTFGTRSDLVLVIE